MNEPITLRELSQDGAQSYDFLRSEGIKLLRQLAGDTWTDHNLHDPGITILEQLCYALTELAYRIDLPVPDLLGREEGGAYQYLPGPAAILTTHPVTLADIRKVVIDVPGVKNAWVEKVDRPNPPLYYHPTDLNLHLAFAEDAVHVPLKGLYRVTFEAMDELKEHEHEQLLTNVKARLQAARGLCEDYETITRLCPQGIRLTGRIEVGETEDIHQLAATVLYQVAHYLSPRVPFYTLPQLLEKGKSIDEIFEGPALIHGFIDDEELTRYDRQTEVHVSDLVREIMDVAGVRGVNELSLFTESSMINENWVLEVNPSKTPALDVDGTLGTSGSSGTLRFEKQGLPLAVDVVRVKELYTEMQEAHRRSPLGQPLRDRTLPEPEDGNLASYHSIHYQFPATYGIGDHDLPDSTPAGRKAQVRQFKAYLTFFEQVLANYYCQLAGFKDLMGFDDQEGASYFHQKLPGVVPGLENVLKASEDYENYLENSAREKAPGERKNRFLNHLMARFGESMLEYSMLQQDDAGQGESVFQRLVRDKAAFLADYLGLSKDRGKAFDYTRDAWDSDNVSGLEKRIARKLGIRDYTRRSLGTGDSEGFHLIEHLLLRPNPEDLDGYPDYLIPKSIEGFEDKPEEESEEIIRCNSIDHRLQTEEWIIIKGSNGYDGEYRVLAVEPDYFEIQTIYKDLSQDGFSPTWERRYFDTRYLVLTDPIARFSESENAGKTTCHFSDHGLEEGEMIRITGTAHYDGFYKVSNLTDESFDIARPFVANEPSGRWVRENAAQDPYSLQVTFLFPGWTGRFTNDHFRQLVEKTVREETPAHLTVYIQWLDQEQMKLFDTAYNDFLSTLKSR